MRTVCCCAVSGGHFVGVNKFNEPVSVNGLSMIFYNWHLLKTFAFLNQYYGHFIGSDRCFLERNTFLLSTAKPHILGSEYFV